jgi:hypothetical protein
MVNEARMRDIAGILNRFPEVAWDRTTANGGERLVFGWVDERIGGRADFVLLRFAANGFVSITTSSAGRSAVFASRLFGLSAEHFPCKRVEEVFADYGVTNVISGLIDSEVEP